ncbi:BlaI/MecI/CopY family transcriptional regulator [Pseudonocardia sp. MH-G8]|uniref:BlaI/MecI/CopY family transcriptional regulator n=1 Tax=Pseudonocardia sp. MH-G8 TaxID=1854588 RepID=UPI001E420106|nr:BlaI/MecI/CopY family transcriptional regulator [Pseudonocardia sp. MH-G8]
MRGFGELEGAVMQHLWAADGGATVREVYEQMRQSRQIAYTTVLSTIHNLHRKGRLTRELEGKAHRYRPTATRAEYSAAVMREALTSGGDSEAILSHFVEQMSTEESRRLQELLGRNAEETSA